LNYRIVTLSLLAVITLIGCSSQQIVGDKPPTVMISIGNEIYETKLGSYCWQNGNTGACVDTVGPVDLLADAPPIRVKPGELITFVMNYEPQPNEFHVVQMTENKETDIELKENHIIAPEEKGIYYYSYGVWWMDENKKNVSHGDAFYAFVIEVN
jgi:hypothetical protein